MRTVTFILFAILFIPITSFSQTVWYVDDDAPNDPGPCDNKISDPLEDGSYFHPYDKLQEGIDASSSGDTVLVIPGTYYEKEVTYRGKAISVRSDFDGDPWTEDIAPYLTIVDAQENGWVFIFNEYEYRDSSLKGFTIQNGYQGNSGGGIICHSSPLIEYNIICDNTTYDYGAGAQAGGIFCGGSSGPLIQYNEIRNNKCYSGAGGYYGGGGLLIKSGSYAEVVNNPNISYS